MHGPPMYYTVEWDKAKTSVERLPPFDPDLVITGHGEAMRGPKMRAALHTLARDFDRVAVPKWGIYLKDRRGRRTDRLTGGEADGLER